MFPIVSLHVNWQFQLQNVGYNIGAVDDLYGALGNFALYAAVTSATIEKTDDDNTFKVSISEVGIYMKDTFDFIGEQYLGHWDFNGMGINVVAGVANLADFEWQLPAWIPTLGIVSSFGNQDFRDYRAKAKQGGDLLLFSDVKKLPVTLTSFVYKRKE